MSWPDVFRTVSRILLVAQTSEVTDRKLITDTERRNGMKTTRNFLIHVFVLAVCLYMAAPAGAELIQHLDASVPESVVMLGGQVQQWKDLSGNENHAVGNRGSVLYPSTPLAGGDIGLDFGFERNDLQLFDNDGTAALLDFTGAAAGNSGFTVFVAFRVDRIRTDDEMYVMGNKNTLNNFSLQVTDDGDGNMSFKFNNNNQTDGESKAAASDTIVFGVSYEAATGAYWFWESKNDVIRTGTQNANFSRKDDQPLVLGEAKSTATSNKFLQGAVGEVMIFNEYIDSADADQYRAELVYQWVTPLAEKLKPGALVPEDGVVEQPVENLSLSWIAGKGSVDQVVYFGTDADTVANATSDSIEYMGTQTEISYALPTLDYGTTYYYRIDSISDDVYSSDVTSFTTVLYAYPLDGDYITATASSTAGALDANVSCNGVGLDPNNEHGTGFNAMWISNPEEDPVWIQYDFDAIVKLNEILIWNHNSEIEDIMGWGIKDATIEYTADGQSWQPLADVTLLPAPGTDQYAANNSIPVGDLNVKGVRINALSNYSDILPNMFGLSEVQFLIVPLQAADPVPTNSQMVLTLDPTLSWTAGRGAVSHDLYMSTDMDAVVNETVTPIALLETSYELEALDVNTVYYWKVNENTGSEVWAGNVWSFTTVASVLLDDMEEYTVDVPNPIYATWVDGYEEPQSNGSLVGADPYTGDGDPFTPEDGDYSPEIVVIRSGLQALPIWFDNTVAPVSTVTRTFTNTEIPDVGAKGMVLYYQFGTDIVGDKLFVEINGVEVASVAIGATIIPIWSEISIDLAIAGIDDAAQITSMTIGVRGANAKGVVYVDDVLLTN